MSASTPPRQVLLVRHGETEWSASRRHTGATDLPLTEAGEIEAAASGALVLQMLGISEPTAVYTSPRRRARRTAELCLGELGRQAIVTDLIAEFDYGDYEGLTSAAINAERPGWEIWRDGCPGGEQSEQVMARARAFRDLLTTTAPSGVVVAFTHGHMSRALAAAFLDEPGSFAAHLHNDTASIAELKNRDGRVTLTGWNLRPHGAAVAT